MVFNSFCSSEFYILFTLPSITSGIRVNSFVCGMGIRNAMKEDKVLREIY